MGCFEGEKLPTSAEGFQDLEERLLRVAQRHLLGPVIGAVLGALHEDEPFVLWSMRAAREQCGQLVGRGDRTVTVTVVGGGEAKLDTPTWRQ